MWTGVGVMNNRPAANESDFSTNNEHWNLFAIKLHCKAIETNIFSDPNVPVPLEWIDRAIDSLLNDDSDPSISVSSFLAELNATQLYPTDTYFVPNPMLTASVNIPDIFLPARSRIISSRRCFMISICSFVIFSSEKIWPTIGFPLMVQSKKLLTRIKFQFFYYRVYSNIL